MISRQEEDQNSLKNKVEIVVQQGLEEHNLHSLNSNRFEIGFEAVEQHGLL